MDTSTVGRKEVTSAGRLAFVIVAAVVGLLPGGLGGVMYILVAVEDQARAHRRLPRTSEATSVAGRAARTDGAT